MTEYSTLVDEDTNDELKIPTIIYWGKPVIFNGNQIPSARFWDLVGAFLSVGKEPPSKLLFAEARRADIYRLIDSGQIIWTSNPRLSDKLLGGNVYARLDKQRVRFLLPRLGVKLAKIEDKPNKQNITELCNECAKLGLYPVANQEHKFYFAAEPEKVFEYMQSTDHVRLAVYLKRPSSSCMVIRLDQEETSSSIS